MLTNDTAGSEEISYYDVSDDTTETAEAKTAITISFPDGLAVGTVYKIVINGDLCANNGLKMGSDYTVYFATGYKSTKGGNNGVVSGGVIDTSNKVDASDVGTVNTSGHKVTLNVDDTKAEAILEDESQDSLAIDVSDIGSNGKQISVKLSSNVVDAAKENDKPIALVNGDLNIVIPVEALSAGKDIEISMDTVDKNDEPAAPSNVNGKEIYEFNANIGGDATHDFGHVITITLPIPEGVSNPEKLGVYYLNEKTGQWEYAGGRIIGDKLVFTTTHFSKYMVGESAKTYADISNHWAKEDIEVMAAKQIVYGVSDTSFAHDTNITRAQFAALLSRILGLTDMAQNTFSDVPADAWYTADVLKAVQAGLIMGEEGKLRPGDPITREEMAVMIMRAYNYAGGQADQDSAVSFTDSAEISSWAIDAVEEASSIGIVGGMPDGTFAPRATATRAEAAVMLKRLMDELSL